MAQRTIPAGNTSNILSVFIQDTASATGAGKTGLAFGTAGLTCTYKRNTASAAVAVSLATMTLGTYTAGGFKEISSSLMPGDYEFCPPDAALATGAQSVRFTFTGAAGMGQTEIVIDLGTGLPVTDASGRVTLTPAEHTLISDTDVPAALTAQGYTSTLATNIGTSNSTIATNLNATVSSRSTYAGADTAGTTTLLSRIASSITIAAGKVAATLGSGDYSGNTPQTGDAYAYLGTNLGALGASATALAPASTALSTAVWTGTIAGRIDAAISSRAASFTTVTLSASQPNYAPAKAGDAMDLVAAPNATAISAIQAGLSTHADATTIETAITNLQAHGDANWESGAVADPWATALPGSYAAGTAGRIVSAVQDLLEADRWIDTGVAPWAFVLIRKGTGPLGTGTELLRQALYDSSGAAINAAATVIGRSIT